jgi:hypothetical protein
MAFWYRTLVMIFLLTTPLAASALGVPPQDARRFVLFLHAGSTKPVDRVVIKKIAVALAVRGYFVREPDDRRNEEGGPGVYFFDEQDLQAARDIAEVVNSEIPAGGKRLSANKSEYPESRRGYIHVWLFD